jgi:NAD(P)-dependent dehydrogenase (short-subunit alcohol dehydrogenase family)
VCVCVCVQLSDRSTTPEGFDTSFATNVLGTTALTQRLLPALFAGAPSRVVFVSSGGMYTQPLCLKDLQHAKLQPWDGSAAYAKEKRCQVALAEHLATAWADQGGYAFFVQAGALDVALVVCCLLGEGQQVYLVRTRYKLVGGVCGTWHVDAAAVPEGPTACQATALGWLGCICEGKALLGGTS